MPDFNDGYYETRLRRFLYLGKEKPEYQPGNWFVHNYFEESKLISIVELAANPLKHDTIISLITEAQTKELIQKEETLIFALALCSQQKIHENLRRKAYDTVRLVCKSPENFILFNKFCSQICKSRLASSSTGWGHGWRRAVDNWYSTKTPMELAKIVTQYKGRYGWKHKDIIKMAHIKAPQQEKKLIFKYVLFGYKKVQELEEFKSERASESVTEIFKFFESIEDFKHCEDDVRAAALIDSLNLTLDHVPGHMLKSEEVWSSLIPTMSLTDLLKNLQRIHNLGFLKPNGVILAKVFDLLNEQNVTNEKIHPAVFLVTAKNYENCGKPLTFEKRKVKEQAKRPLPPPPDANKKVLDTLNKMLNFSFTTLQPTNVHYMITINMNKTMLDNGCWQCGNVKAAEAGCLIALSLLRAEKDVTVATFINNGVKCIDVDVNSSLVQMMRKLERTNVETINLSKPMAWATQKNKSIDVFINIIDQICPKSDFSEEGIKTYRSKMNLPNAKLVNCAMCASSTYEKSDYDKNILTVCGFDEKVPKIIEAFARSYF